MEVDGHGVESSLLLGRLNFLGFNRLLLDNCNLTLLFSCEIYLVFLSFINLIHVNVSIFLHQVLVLVSVDLIELFIGGWGSHLLAHCLFSFVDGLQSVIDLVFILSIEHLVFVELEEDFGDWSGLWVADFLGNSNVV